MSGAKQLIDGMTADEAGGTRDENMRHNGGFAEKWLAKIGVHAKVAQGFTKNLVPEKTL